MIARIRHILALVAAWLVLVAPVSPAWATGGPKDMPEVGRGRVVALDGAVVLRLDDGTPVRLALLEDRAAARAEVARLVTGRDVVLHWPDPQSDRHGRRVAHVVRADDGLWVQGAVVAAGAARVVTFADERAAAPALLTIEAEARAAGRGLWQRPEFAPLPAASAVLVDDALGRLALVEGVVHAAAVVRGRLYLNFDADWRTDFTISIAPASLRTFPPDQREAAFWEGRSVRVRGWVRRLNGPVIDVDHPERLEIVPSH